MVLQRPLGQLSSQLVSSFSTTDLANQPFGQAVQEAAIENGLLFGADIYEPGGQHPKRPVEPVDDENARDQHKVFVKPLNVNTLNKKKDHRMIEFVMDTYLYKRQEKRTNPAQTTKKNRFRTQNTKQQNV